MGGLASKHNSRILIGGDGADEIHFGYPQYLDIARNEVSLLKMSSPYSSYEMDEELSLFGHLRFPHFNSDQSHPDLLIDLRTEYTKLLNNLFPTSNIFNIFRKLSIIMDTRFNLHSTSLLANDLILSDFSIEGRNPFVSIVFS